MSNPWPNDIIESIRNKDNESPSVNRARVDDLEARVKQLEQQEVPVPQVIQVSQANNTWLWVIIMAYLLFEAAHYLL